MIEANSDGDWMILNRKSVRTMCSNLSDTDMDYFLWFMNFLGWQIYKDKQGELDLPVESILFKYGMIEGKI